MEPTHILGGSIAILVIAFFLVRGIEKNNSQIQIQKRQGFDKEMPHVHKAFIKSKNRKKFFLFMLLVALLVIVFLIFGIHA